MRTLCEHPAWVNGRRVVRGISGVSVATVGAAGITLSAVGPVVDVYDPAELSAAAPTQLRRLLAPRGPVARLRTPDLWEAIAAAIIRQVIRADQARKMYQRFAEALSEPVAEARPFPSTAAVLALDDKAFTDLGAAFKRRPLQAAAEAYTDQGAKWAQLPPKDLVEELQDVPRIGPWTAGAAVADFSGDFSLYPYGDMAVRKYARQAFPDLNLPDKEVAFATRWASFGSAPSELSVLTALTLSLGGDRAPEPPGNGPPP